MSFVLTLLTLTLAVGVLYFQAWRKKNRLAAPTWDQLIARLGEVPMEGIARVAHDYLEPKKGQLAIETNELWSLVGGSEGLSRMEANAEVLLQLAAWAQQWNFEESTIVAERMRREALQLRRAVRKIQLSLLTTYGATKGPFWVQEAATAYYLMRQRLLALYETSHAGRYGRLACALDQPMAA